MKIMACVEVPLKHKLVHLDLKGAPPKIEYLEKIIPLMKSWGMTGLLVEYEDCFPYVGECCAIHSKQFYNQHDILALQNIASRCNVIIIPLVQTFGHMEFVLKHSCFKHLREVANSPMSLCPSNTESLQLVCEMLDQVIGMHTDLQWIHIGCDEVYNLGKCERCQRRLTKNSMSNEQLFIQHVKDVSMYIKENHPGITPIVWDDMFRFTDLVCLKDSDLGQLVEPMVWHYLTTFQLPFDLWEKLSAVFSNIWVASSFKGATGTRNCISDVSYHVENHRKWLSTLQHEQCRFASIRGMALTGWQRYDHYAVMCELLPQALPSLGICLQVLAKGTFTIEQHKRISDDLGFKSLLPLNPFICTEVPQCSFPGSAIYQLMMDFFNLKSQCALFLDSDRCLTWMNEYYVNQNFTNSSHLESVLRMALMKLQCLEYLHQQLSTALSEIYFTATVDEWLGTHLSCLIRRMRQCQETATNQLLVV